MDQIPDIYVNAKLNIEKLFTLLWKRKHFINCFSDESGGYNGILYVLKQPESSLVDLLLITRKEKFRLPKSPIETATLENYNQSHFASSRSSLASIGKTLKPDELDASYLLDTIFKKTLLFASKIEICDRIFGRKFNDNFEYTITSLFKWLEKNAINSNQLKEVVIHCEKPSDDPRSCTVKYMKTKIATIKKGRFRDLKIDLRFYPAKKGPEDILPHDRFFMTDQVALIIGRGMDFLSKRTKRNRDTTINYCDCNEIRAIINSCNQYILDESMVL